MSQLNIPAKMDLLNIPANIDSILGLTNTAVRCLLNVKRSFQERESLLEEVTGVRGILHTLKDLTAHEQSDESAAVAVRSLAGPNGPLDQFKVALEQLVSKLAPAEGMRKVGKALDWPRQREDVRAILARIERLKTLFGLALKGDQLALSRAMKDDVSKVREEVMGVSDQVARLQNSNMHQESWQREQESRDILAWISSLDYPKQQSDFIATRETGTGQWLLESTEFERWCRGSRETLFCPGIPGAGKTMLAAIAIDHLLHNIRRKGAEGQRIGVAYVYCSYRMQEDQTSAKLLASLLAQLLQGSPSLSTEVRALYAQHRQTKTSLTHKELLQLLRSEINKHSQVFIVVDALDECTNDDGTRDELCSTLRSIQDTCALNLMMTSRPIAVIERHFQQAVSLEIRAGEADVRKYLAGRMHRLTRCVQGDEELQELIISSIVRAADEMFLLARLHFESLTDKTSRKLLKAAIKVLPNGSDNLHRAYDDAMARVDSQRKGHKDGAYQVLAWVTHAKRSMTTTELQTALAVEPGEAALNEDGLEDIEELVSYCAGLVVIDKESSVVRLVHETTQHYLEHISPQRFPDAQKTIATTCLSYLDFDIFGAYLRNAKDSCDSRGSYSTAFAFTQQNLLRHTSKHPFLKYAACNWSSHLTRELERELRLMTLAFLRDISKSSLAYQVWAGGAARGALFDDRMPGLHLAAFFGLEDTTASLIEAGFDASSKAGDDRTPLHWAAAWGQEAVVKMLLDRYDVVADCKDNQGQTPLLRAASLGREAVVKMLLDRDDVAADCKDNYGRTPLHRAASCGEEAVVKMLLDRDDVVADCQDNYGRTPLHRAALLGKEAVVKMLLDRDDVVANCKDNHHGQTPLHGAASLGKEAVVKMLLDRDDVVADCKDNHGQTPLHRAALLGKEAVVKMLLDRDDVAADCKDNHGQTPLHGAASLGKEAVVKMLLDRDDVAADCKDNQGQTPLHGAANRGAVGVIALLLGRQVDLENRDQWKNTPLHCACEGSESWMEAENVDTVNFLLDAGADVHAQNFDGNTPLIVAIEKCTRLEQDSTWLRYRSKDNAARNLKFHQAIVQLLKRRMARQDCAQDASITQLG